MERSKIIASAASFLAALALVALAACQAPQDGSGLVRSAKAIRIETRMPAASLQQALGREKSGAANESRFETIVVPGPIDFELLIGGGSIRLADSGRASFAENSFLFSANGLEVGTIYPQAAPLSLREAIDKGKAIVQSFDQLDLVGSLNFSAVKAPPESRLAIADWETAEELLEDDDALIAEVGLYSGADANTAVTLSIFNPSRLRKLIATRREGELTNEWRLRVQIVTRDN